MKAHFVNVDFQTLHGALDFDSFPSSIPKPEHIEEPRYAGHRCRESDLAISALKREKDRIETIFDDDF